MLTSTNSKKTAKWRTIARLLLQRIHEQQLIPGDKLPPERELAEQLGVSRTSLREALRALTMLNVLEMRPGAGTYITSLEPGLLIEPLNLTFQLTDSSILELFTARKVLEVGIAGVAATSITDEEIALLEESLAHLSQNLDNPELALIADLELHNIIVQATHNPILIRMMTGIKELGLASRNRTVRIPGALAQSLEDHRMIVNALKTRDSSAAQAAMLIHLNRLETKLKTAIEADTANNTVFQKPPTDDG